MTAAHHTAIPADVRRAGRNLIGDKGLLMFMPVGFGGATVKICPPLIISDDALAESLHVFEEAFAEVAAEHKVEAAAR